MEHRPPNLYGMVLERDSGLSALLKVNTPRSGILRCAILSRCLVILLSAASNYIIPDHNATDVFTPPAEDEDEHLHGFHFFDDLVKTLLGGMARWDAQYFLHIAKHDYVFENSLAFFPLFPLLTRWLSVFLGYFLFNLLTESSTLLLSASILNFFAFLKAADILYSLSIFVLDDIKLSYISAMLFCFNPASIFFSAPYSETLFCLLTFSGLYHTFKSNWDFCSSILLGLSAGTRSNGILNIGFILYKKVKHLVVVLWPGTLQLKLMSNPLFCLKTILVWIFSVIVPCILISIPFLTFEAYSYFKFCTPQDINLTPAFMNYAVENGLVLPSLGGKETRLHSHWCHSSIPLAYSYVQNVYWNVGFLKYFQVSQIPNFLLALPVVILILSHGAKFFSHHKNMCLKLGFTGKSVPKSDKTFRISANMFVFVVHSVALTLFCVFCIHVEVTTRMLFSASPVPYWAGAYIFHEGFVLKENIKKYKAFCLEWKYVNSLNDLRNYVASLKVLLTKSGKFLVLYFLVYFVIGTVLFSNFLPWT